MKLGHLINFSHSYQTFEVFAGEAMVAILKSVLCDLSSHSYTNAVLPCTQYFFSITLPRGMASPENRDSLVTT